jgi:hypothetical protein
MQHRKIKVSRIAAPQPVTITHSHIPLRKHTSLFFRKFITLGLLLDSTARNPLKCGYHESVWWGYPYLGQSTVRR